jgi:hypothetical protein
MREPESRPNAKNQIWPRPRAPPQPTLRAGRKAGPCSRRSRLEGRAPPVRSVEVANLGPTSGRWLFPPRLWGAPHDRDRGIALVDHLPDERTGDGQAYLDLVSAICETSDGLPVETGIRRQAGIVAKSRVAAFVPISAARGSGAGPRLVAASISRQQRSNGHSCEVGATSGCNRRRSG